MKYNIITILLIALLTIPYTTDAIIRTDGTISETFNIDGCTVQMKIDPEDYTSYYKYVDNVNIYIENQCGTTFQFNSKDISLDMGSMKIYGYEPHLVEVDDYTCLEWDKNELNCLNQTKSGSHFETRYREELVKRSIIRDS